MADTLDNFEQKIEDNIADYKKLSSSKKKKVENILSEAKKTKNVNIRINNVELDILRKRASQEGLPYQTYISSILHKYLTNQLIEESSILKLIKSLNINKI